MMPRVAVDDFAPRHEYPESMRRLEEYIKKSGHNYGKYVQENPDPPREAEPERLMRKCYQCGKEFEAEYQKERQQYSRYKRCPECRGVGKEYRLICQRCGAEMTAKTKKRKYCDECAKALNRERSARATVKKKEEAERNKRLWASGAFV